MPELTPGSIWERNGERFIIIESSDIEMKDADAAGWSPAVSYRRDDFSGALKVRSQKDFLAKFQLGE